MANDITIFQGNDKTLRVTIIDIDGEAFDLTSATVYFNVKKYESQTEYLINLSSVVVTEIKILAPAADGIVEIYLVPANTAELNGEYKYDITLSVGGKKYTIEKGEFTVVDPVRN